LLSYDEKNPLVVPTLDYLQRVGVVKKKTTHKTSLDEALEDIKKGRIYTLCSRKTRAKASV
ncbi:MAG: hypothetical protein LBN95_02645, partial [Prevotellaceae bacterium]|nr:hypothetical protein [Prevotellaceae bacterium]